MVNMESNLGGTQLGKYEIQAEVGRGGMGVVYKGYDPSLDRLVAVKVLAPHLVWEKEFVERFVREARSAARLKHANIVTIHDVGQTAGWYYFVMEFLEGSTLTEAIQERGPLAPDEALSLLRPIADALDYAHRQGLVHRDVKPGNVVVDPTGHVTLTDFGIARATRETRLTATGTIVGTPEYMSPEQAKGLQVNASSDLYSLAIVAYEMLSGRVPFEAESALALLHKIVYDPLPSICQVNADLPAGVEAVMKKALAKEPDDRYKEAGVFIEMLARTLAGEQVEKAATLVLESERPAPTPMPATVPTPKPSLPDEAAAPVIEREETKAAPVYVQPPPAPVPTAAPASVPTAASAPDSGQTKATHPDTQPSAPARRRVGVWVWALGAVVVLVVVGLTIGTGRDTTSYPVVPTLEKPYEGLNGVYYYTFNTKLEPFDNPLVRQAFSLAIDRETLAEIAKEQNPGGQYVAATTLTPPTILGLELYNQVGLPYDPERANALLAEAGFPGGEGLPEITLWVHETEFDQRIAEQIKNQWYSVFGLDVSLETKPWLDYEAMRYGFPHQVWHWDWYADYVDPHNFFYDAICGNHNSDFDWDDEHSSLVESIADAPDEATRRTRIETFSNRICANWDPTLSEWENDEYRTLIQEALYDLDEKARLEKYVQAERILCEDDAVVIPLFHYHGTK